MTCHVPSHDVHVSGDGERIFLHKFDSFIYGNSRSGTGNPKQGTKCNLSIESGFFNPEMLIIKWEMFQSGKSDIVANSHSLWEIWYLNKHIFDQLDDNYA